MENATIPHIFTSLPLRKKYIAEGSKRVIDIVNDGDICPLKVATSLKAMEIAIKIIKEGIAEAVENEAAKEPGNTFERNGHSYNVRNSASYNYSNCGDPVLERITEKSDNIAEERKDRELFLKSLKASLNIVDEDTGEIVEVYPPSKSGKTVIAITLAK